ncbi:CHAP domain-containing protein [Nonomuraea antimicrobica]
MAKHRITDTSKSPLVRALVSTFVGATVIATALGSHAVTASADSAIGVATATGARHPDAAVAAHKDGAESENKVNVTAEQVLALAKSQIGTSENVYGGGTKYQQWYADSQRAAETIARDGGNRTAYLNAAWCAMFVSWVGDQTGARRQIGWDAYTVTHAKWFAANNRFGTVPKPGAVVFFSWGQQGAERHPARRLRAEGQPGRHHLHRRGQHRQRQGGGARPSEVAGRRLRLPRLRRLTHHLRLPLPATPPPSARPCPGPRARRVPAHDPTTT